MYIEIKCGSTKHHIPFKDRKRIQQLIDLLKPVRVSPLESKSRAQDAVNTLVNEAERYAKALDEEEAIQEGRAVDHGDGTMTVPLDQVQIRNGMVYFKVDQS